MLFEDKREVELVWNGKTRDVCTTVLPFQMLEHIDEPRTEAKRQEELFDPLGRQLRGWTIKLIWGDNKLFLSSLKSGALRRQIEEAGGLKVICIDPTFDVGADFSMDIEIGGETFHKEPNLPERPAAAAGPFRTRSRALRQVGPEAAVTGALADSPWRQRPGTGSSFGLPGPRPPSARAPR
jgi:hypothetical protein